ETGGGGLSAGSFETIWINTHGEIGFNHGASFLDGSGIAATTDLVVYGGQDLTAVDLGGDAFYGYGLTGDLEASFGSASTFFVANQGMTVIDMGAGNDTMHFYGLLGDDDVAYGGSGTDALYGTIGTG